ncbi:MAG: DEAD/DEAH box helicase [Chlamydiia bacterium]|nr:DEAD/DEAH box helicase [Chlamydiia bacterium]
MLNFRKLKQDYSPRALKEGKAILEKEMVAATHVQEMSAQRAHLKGEVQSQYDTTYNCHLEIDLKTSTIVDSECECPDQFDCQHIAALLFHLEEHFNDLVVDYSKKVKPLETKKIEKSEKKELEKAIQAAEKESRSQKEKKFTKELLHEYAFASKVLGQSPFFLQDKEEKLEKCEIFVVFEEKKKVEVQLAIKLESRTKPLLVPDINEFLETVQSEESYFMGNKRFRITLESFNPISKRLFQHIGDFIKADEGAKIGSIEYDKFGTMLAEVYDQTSKQLCSRGEEEFDALPCFFVGSLDEPLRFSVSRAKFNFVLEYLTQPAPKIMLKPLLDLGQELGVDLASVTFYEPQEPGLIYQNTYYQFHPSIKRKHLKSMAQFQDLTIPEPLFGAFVENSLPELSKIARVSNKEVMRRFVTLPFINDLKAECDLNYLNGELEAALTFIYGKIKIPAASSKLTGDQALSFVTDKGILARNLTEEQAIVQALFQDFTYDPHQGFYIAKNDKKIVEFMTEVIPQYSEKVTFNCPENLLEQFLYDQTTYTLDLKESKRVDRFVCDLKVDGHLKGVSLDVLWECLLSKKPFIEKKMGKGSSKILVLDLEKLQPIIQIFDEVGIKKLDNHTEERPLFNLVTLDESMFDGLPIKFSMSEKLKRIQKQMTGNEVVNPSPIPPEIKHTLRNYQLEGVQWLEKLRQMHLGGVLADDMGLGKTFQSIIALTQYKKEHPKGISIIICPTSLVYNWKEELLKFNPKLKAQVIDGTPETRRKLIEDRKSFDILITSYSLLQKDVEVYEPIDFGYVILDEAQNIKNRGTRNAKSVKEIKGAHRLILTGTPIENSLEELWSLFDFLMPGLLSSYERFVEKYIRNPVKSKQESLESLKRKASPFILRRMKKDVLKELPPVSEITYHCHLSEAQRELYRSYAQSAREELEKLVKKEGFEKVQIHVLATLTRLKQICCHPAIFAKEKAEPFDSTKYDMLMDLLKNLIESNHKTVIFSQYTKMLSIMKEDLDKMGVRFEYLDGTTKNRLDIVKKFNEDENISVFLVSLKAGGSGLNLVGADTVIHYDMWWNPAVESQATDRVHRIGQTRSVSSYKLVTLNTIEEKIVELQSRKKELVKQVVNCDEEAISKLTWEEVLELLQT